MSEAKSHSKSDADIAYLPLTELVAQYRAKTISPVEATRIALARIEAHDKKVNSYCHLDAEGAMAAARAAEARWAKGEPQGLIDGVPISVKDTMHARGMPTRFGSHTTPTAPSAVDTSIVQACRRHGAVLLGKTTNPEFAIGPITISPLTGTTTNPYDPTTHAGGSSGGASAALAGGMGNVALGSDAGGSGRIPAALCNLVFHKATTYRIPAAPPSAMPSLSCLGALTRTVADSALMMNVMTEPDWRDYNAHPYDGTDYTQGLDDGVRGLRIAYSGTMGYARYVDPEVAQIVRDAAYAFAGLGAKVEDKDPGSENPVPILTVILATRMAYRLSKFTPQQLEVVGPMLTATAERGRKMTTMDVVDADEKRAALTAKLTAFFQDYDLLITPTLTVPAFDATRQVPQEFEQFENPREWVPFCSPFNLSQQPALALPCGFTKAGLPVSLQIVGARHADRLVLRAAQAYERLNPQWQRRPTGFA